ncbi:ParB N-terminal domain-containing protein [Massilia sp. UMI-21]|nr:ParB N-terminal domain-containing protein [Massilia sp. UMI-21]
MSSVIDTVNYKKLHLDIDNPRLPVNVPRTAKAMLTWIAKSTAIEDLMNAIGTNGFFPGEPLVVYPHPKKKGEYIVIEGNRRLTAVKLLHNPYDCEKPSSQMLAISESAAYFPDEIPIVVRDTRAEVLPYLGYRHITGIKEWDPLAKARYLKQLFEDTSKRLSPDQRYAKVASTIGSRRDHIKRSLDALAVYDLIEKREFFGIEGLGEESIKFSLLSTALADERIGEFVGAAKRISKASEDLETEPTNPIVKPSVLKTAAVEDLARWLFEKKNGKTVVGESRNLRTLGAIVAAPKALAALRSKSSLSYAYRLTSGINNDFVGLIYEAQSILEEAASLVANVDYDEEAMSVVRASNNLIKQIGTSLRNKKAGDADEF